MSLYTCMQKYTHKTDNSISNKNMFNDKHFFLLLLCFLKKVEKMILNAYEQTSLKSANNFIRLNELSEKLSVAYFVYFNIGSISWEKHLL